MHFLNVPPEGPLNFSQIKTKFSIIKMKTELKLRKLERQCLNEIN